MLKRAKALQKKQRSGQGAPPTPTLRFSSVSSTPTVPDFTPVHPARRQGVKSMQPRIAAPSFLAQTTQRLPPSLLAPRYSHLLEEAKSLSKQDSLGPRAAPDESPAPPTPVATDGPVDAVTSHVKQEESEQEIPLTPTVRSRVKGFLFSYLPTLKKKTPAQKYHEPARPALPLPPPELLEKPRGPIITPKPKPAPRSTHPKELVHLQHAPTPSVIPTLPRIPKRLVDLRPVSPPPSVASAPINIPEGRRSSGGSVKELVSSFEEMDRSKEIEAHALELRRKKSAALGAANATTTTTNTTRSRPAWR